MKKSLEPGLFLIKKENLSLKEENSKLKARVENIENKLSEAKLFELLFPVVVASMLTVWGYALGMRTKSWTPLLILTKSEPVLYRAQSS